VRRALLAVLALAFAAAALGGRRASAAPDAAAGFDRLVAARAPSVVPVRGVMKTSASFQGQSFEQEQSATIVGAVLDSSGLVAALDVVGLVTKLAQKALPAGVTFSVTPSRIRVLLGDDQKEYDAVDVVRDAEAGIAWVQVVEPPGPLPAVDLAGETRLRVGQDLAGVARLPRGFDFAPELRLFHVERRVERPRPMWGLSQGAAPGVPAYDLDGKTIGLVVARIEADEISLASLVGGNPLDVGGAFVLPLDEVRRSLAEAKKRVPAALERAKAAAKEPAKPEAPAKEGGGAPAGGTPPAPATPPPTPTAPGGR
jgi:hypothetical protein